MSKSLLEKYEQMLAQDPASTVFIELARAYLERGDTDQAIAVCQQGVGHHPTSIAGRVLWGKALINAGKAADAMQQFDQAMSVEKDNPHAYNLIGEVLLRKGLFRSALPVLRKAAALQPNDNRVRQWLEQTRAALAGGPAPVLYDSTSVDIAALPDPQAQAPAPEAPVSAAPAVPQVAPRPSSPPVPTMELPQVSPRPSSPPVPTTELPAVQSPRPSSPGADPDVFAAFGAAPAHDPDGQPTVLMNAYRPGPTAEMPAAWPSAPRSQDHKPGPPVPTGEMPLPPSTLGANAEDSRPTREIPVSLTPSQRELPVVAGTLEGRSSPTAEIPAATASGEAPDPFAALMGHAEVPNETFRGLTSTFDALADPQGAQTMTAPAVAPTNSTPSVIPSADLVEPQRPAGGGLLDDVASAQNEIPTSEISLGSALLSPVPQVVVPRPAGGGGGLLDDIPDELPEVAAPVAVASAPMNTQAAEAVAREYERELREKLEATTSKKTFLQRHGLWVGVGALLVVAVGGLGFSYLRTLRTNGGDLVGVLGQAISAINADTKEQYAQALQATDRALKMDDGNVDAQAWAGYAHAMLFAEHGGASADRDLAVAAFAQTRVREAHPDLGVVVDYLTADPAQATAARQALLGSTVDQSVVHTQQARVLLADQKFDDAQKQLQAAVTQNKNNLRALVLSGEYYLSQQDWENAFTVLGTTAEPLSRFHPVRVMGLAQARLELGRELSEALSELQGLPQNAAIPEALKSRYALMLGRALGANGKTDEALKVLGDGLSADKGRAYEFELALAQVYRGAGLMEKAQKAFEEAMKLSPKAEEPKEGLGRVLLARSREKELLERLKPEKDARKVALVRGIAWSRLNDPRRARQELAATQVGGKYPAEAAVYLALSDAAEEQATDKTIAALEKLVTQTRRNKATVQVALARVYMKAGALDKAKAQLEEAAKDPADYEGNSLLGELLLQLPGVPEEVALEPLQRAVDRNGSHAPSRHLLARTLLSLGRGPEAMKQIEAWTLDNPALDQAWKDAALVELETGHAKEAEASITRAVRADSDDVEGFRLKARVLFARGDGKGAFAALERANKLNAQDAETFCEIGHAFVRQGSPDLAQKAYEAAVKADAKSVCGQVGPWHAHPAAKGKAPLQALLKNAVHAWDKAFIDATLARCLAEEKDYKAALASAEDAIAVGPASAPAWFALGEVARRQKNEARALEAYGNAAGFDQSWSQARLAYADSLLKSGGDNLPKAADEYEAVTQYSQNDGDLMRAKNTARALRKQLK